MREHLVSRQMPAAYDPAATCPAGCLPRTSTADAEVRAFLQRLGGACLWYATEHGFIFNHGQAPTSRRIFGGHSP